MRALQCQSLGKPSDLKLVDIPGLPSPKAGEIKLQVASAGLNFADTLMIAGQYQHKPELPFIPGLELAGTVLEVGPAETRIKPGDPIMAAVDHGGFASQAIVRAADAVPIPTGMDPVTAGGFVIAYGTSYGALVWKARLQAGELLLVHGAAGGVGLTAVEIGKALGAKVIATAGGAEKCAVAREHGADWTVDYKTENVRDRVKAIAAELGRDGADVVYDPVGGELFDASLRCVAWGARLLVVGFAAGQIQKIPANILLVKNIDAQGFYWGSYRRHRPELIGECFAGLARFHAAGSLQPHISHRFDLADFAQAFEVLVTRKSTGKIVLTP
ncbi:NADPH:quinone oxidoreductase family protein [Dongia sedimenti]|uniref:NADPH:quinone oxidoreductase family protein n=1 Tax=Dongia sedimenti TaxID=3064282 RepID=A0ABU0YQQ6_9PROT|nr:NADPH:quinone oxidoreductase family protein [Rhodospirillaceae bacterium R-7]